MFAPPPCPNCITEIHGNGTCTITIPESAEIGPAPCANCDAEVFFDAAVFGEKRDVLGKLTIKYVDQEGIEQTIDTGIQQAKIKEKSFVLESIDGVPCDACEQFRFTLGGKFANVEQAMTLEGNYGIEGQFAGTVAISSTTG